MLNKVILQGRLTQDVEVKQTQTGKSVTSFTLAVERDYSANGEKETDFINIVAWGNTADFIGKYFGKGKQMLVTGSLNVRKYQTQSGENRYVTEVKADSVYFCGDKEKATQGENNVNYNPYQTPQFEEVSNDDEGLPF
jgi:single-strand DNA-binding protein